MRTSPGADLGRPYPFLAACPFAGIAVIVAFGEEEAFRVDIVGRGPVGMRGGTGSTSLPRAHRPFHRGGDGRACPWFEQKQGQFRKSSSVPQALVWQGFASVQNRTINTRRGECVKTLTKSGGCFVKWV